MAGRRFVVVARGQKALLDRNGDLFGKTDADEAAGRQRVTVADELHGGGGGNDLSLLVAL